MNLDDLKREATAAAREYRQRVAAIDADSRLSPQGKAEQTQAATVAYQTTVSRLQQQAQARLDRQRAALPEKRKTATLKRAAVLSGIMSEVIRYDLLQRRLATMTGMQLVMAARATGDDWERAIMLESGKISFASEPATIAGLEAVERQTAWGADLVSCDEEARELEQAARTVELLDVERARQTMADKYGTKPEFLPASVPFGA